MEKLFQPLQIIRGRVGLPEVQRRVSPFPRAVLNLKSNCTEQAAQKSALCLDLSDEDYRYSVVFHLMVSACDFIPESPCPKWLQGPAIVSVSQAGDRTNTKRQCLEMLREPSNLC